MKKKLLLVLSLVAVFVSLFAISAFATEIDGIYYTLNVTDKEAKTGTASVNSKNATECTLTDVVIPSTVTKDGYTYTVTAIDYHAFSGAQSAWGKNQTIKTLYIPETVSSIGGHFLRECKSIESVVIDAKNPNGISLPDAEFYQCTNLTYVDMSKSDIKSFGQYTFYSCSSLTNIKLPPKLKTVGTQAFRHCSALTSIDFLNTELETIGTFAFNSCSKLATIRFSTTLKSISGNAIQGVKVTQLVLPHSFNKTSGEAIPALSSLYLMVVPEMDSTSSFSTSTFYGTYPEVVLYAGDLTSAQNYLLGTTDSKKLFNDYTVKPFSEYDATKTYSGKNFFYGATTCSKCNGLYESDTEQVYFKDYLSGFSKGKLCTNCEKVDATQESDAMFTFVGFSIPENGDAGFVVKYTVNNEAIALYKELTGKDVAFGLYAATETKLDGGDIFDEKGMPNEGALKAEVGSGFMILELKVAGFTTEEQKAEKLALGVYVETTFEETKEYSFLNQEIPAEGDKYFFVSYNDVLDLVK